MSLSSLCNDEWLLLLLALVGCCCSNLNVLSTNDSCDGCGDNEDDNLEPFIICPFVVFVADDCITVSLLLLLLFIKIIDEPGGDGWIKSNAVVLNSLNDPFDPLDELLRICPRYGIDCRFGGNGGAEMMDCCGVGTLVVDDDDDCGGWIMICNYYRSSAIYIADTMNSRKTIFSSNNHKMFLRLKQNEKKLIILIGIHVKNLDKQTKKNLSDFYYYCSHCWIYWSGNFSLFF